MFAAFTHCLLGSGAALGREMGLPEQYQGVRVGQVGTMGELTVA